jgi:DNA-binding NarL/FixJ family response regulator
MSAEHIRVLAVDDHPLVRKGVAAVLETEPGVRLVGEAANGAEAIAQFRALLPDVTLIDLRMPDLSGVDVILRVREEFPEARFIALTSYDGDQDIYRALDAGVRGYLLKELVHSEIGKAIRVVHSGARYLPQAVTQQLAEFFPNYALTPREVEVLRLVAGGLGNREIGHQLGTASGTVKAHVQSILSKLGAKDRTHAVSIAVRRGIIHLNEPECELKTTR